MNTLKTTFILGVLTALVLGIGYYVGGQNGIFVALILSVLMNFGSYWFSDKIVLALYKAKEIPSSEYQHIHQMVQELSVKASIPTPKLYLVSLPTPNAFATGRDEKHAVVALTSGIINLLSPDELRGVIAHEIAHIKNRDILISSIAATLAGALSYIAQMAYMAGAFTGGSRDERGGSPLGTFAILIITPFVATLLHLAVSRSREYIADETASRISGAPKSLANALKKLHDSSLKNSLLEEPKYEATAHMFIVNPFKPSFVASLFSTHPPVMDRIKRLEDMAV